MFIIFPLSALAQTAGEEKREARTLELDRPSAAAECGLEHGQEREKL
jgi:hypothetical protein